MLIYLTVDTENNTLYMTNWEDTFFCIQENVNFHMMTLQNIVEDAEMMTESAEED
jgi:hypothetical protein